MSEYQYYEFRSIDRPLDRDQMDELRQLSTRAEITSSSFTNTYNYGNFRGRPEKLIDRYFDAFVYVANWGTHRLMLRMPRRFLDVQSAAEFAAEDALAIRASEDHVVIAFLSQEEGGEWVNGEPWMDRLIGIRTQLLQGDLRALYIGWLASLPDRFGYELEDPEEGADELEPPVPPGLGKLSPPLVALAEFLRVGGEWLAAAAEASTGEPPDQPSRDDLGRWVKKLPSADKDVYLLRLLSGESDLLIRSDLFRRHAEAAKPKHARASGTKTRRTVAQLFAAVEDRKEAEKRQKAERAAADRARRDRERAQYLDDLAGREAETWREVESLITTKQPANYDRAVALVADLRDLSERWGRKEAAEAKVRELRERHRAKTALLRRLNRKDPGR
jgi:hypothetical protein